MRNHRLRGELRQHATQRQLDVQAAYREAGGSVSLRARTGLTTERLIYRGRTEARLVVPGLEPGAGPTSRVRRGIADLRPAYVIALVALLALALAGGALLIGGRLVAPRPIAHGYESIYLRWFPADAPHTHIDVVAVRPDGEERLLRRIGVRVEGTDLPLTPGGTVSRGGWLAIETESRGGSLPVNAYALFDLADSTRKPMVVPHPEVIGPRWSSTDLLAISSAAKHTPTGWLDINVVDPRAGVTTGLGRPGLFGGMPSIVWASDGSGIIDGDVLRPATGGPSVPIGPDLLFDDPMVGRGGRQAHATTSSLISPGYVRVADLTGRTSDWYAWDDLAVTVGDPIFAPPDSPIGPGQSLLFTQLRSEGVRRQAVIVRLDSPFVPTTIATIDLPDGARMPFLSDLAPDGSIMNFNYLSPEGTTEPTPTIRLTGNGSRIPVPEGTPAGYVLASVVESWPTVDGSAATR